MTQEIEPFFTKAKATYATGFKGQLLKSEPLLISHEPNELFPDKLFNYQTMKYNIIRQIIKNSIF